MFLCRAFPTKSRPECLTVGQTACFRSFPAQRDGRCPLLLSSIYPHWGLMSPGEEKKKKIFKQPRCFGHLWSRRSDGSSSSAELMLNNGAKALDPLTPPPPPLLAMGTRGTNKCAKGRQRHRAGCSGRLELGSSRTWPRFSDSA